MHPSGLSEPTPSRALPALLTSIPCRGKPLREFDVQRTGREWRRPSATTEIKVGRE